VRIEFRKFDAANLPEPGPGEVFVKRSPAHAKAEPGLALLVVGHGVDALVRGGSEPEVLVVDAAFTSPTLDEMLAAAFARRLLDHPGERLPAGCAPLARYARLVLRGHRPPGPVRPEDSVEGIYQAVRNCFGTSGEMADLTVPQVAGQFLARWERMEACLLRAAAAGVNFSAASPFKDNPEFDEERAFLEADRRKYRADVRRGRRWRVFLPGSAGREGGLLLRRPGSLLFKHWAREDPDAPGRAGYLFLVVDWGEGRWVFTTDPTRQTPIAGLTAELQRQEERRDPGRAQQEPWYDGHRPEHAGTLVASPKAGSGLPDPEVLAAVRQWADARPAWRVPPAEALLAYSLVLAAAVLAARGLFPPPPRDPGPFVRNEQPVDLRPWRPWRLTTKADGWVIEGGKEEQKELRLEGEKDGERPSVPWRSRIKVVLRSATAPPAGAKVSVGVGADEKSAALLRSDTDEAVFLTEAFEFLPRQETAVFRVRSPTREDWEVGLSAEVLPQNLYVLAVGVSEYDVGGVGDVRLARNDPPELEKAFKSRCSSLFNRVEVRTVVSDDAGHRRPSHPETGRDAIYDGLGWLRRNAKPVDVAVVVLSGHGYSEGGEYLFAPSNYDPSNPGKWGVSGLNLVQQLAGVRCPTLLAVDTCHSGSFVNAFAVSNLRPGGMLFLASARPDQESVARETWGHGPLVLALLEVLDNRRRVDRHKGWPLYRDPELSDGLVTWGLLIVHVRSRMDELVGNRQTFEYSIPVPDRGCSRYPIALPPDAAAGGR
jgi:hypothetical protein